MNIDDIQLYARFMTREGYSYEPVELSEVIREAQEAIVPSLKQLNNNPPYITYSAGGGCIDQINQNIRKFHKEDE